MFCFVFLFFLATCLSCQLFVVVIQKLHNVDALLLFAAVSCRFVCMEVWLCPSDCIWFLSSRYDWPLSLFPDLHCLLPSALEFSLGYWYWTPPDVGFFFFQVTGYMFLREGRSFIFGFLIGSWKISIVATVMTAFLQHCVVLPTDGLVLQTIVFFVGLVGLQTDFTQEIE